MNGEYSKVESVSTDPASHTLSPWTLETVPTSIGICHKIGPFPTNNGYHKESHACIYGDGLRAGDEKYNKVAAELLANARLIAAAPDLLACLKEMGDWIAAGLQASDEAWPDAQCLKRTEEIAARARAAVDKAEGRS
jgi:hypothetical protein